MTNTDRRWQHYPSDAAGDLAYLAGQLDAAIKHNLPLTLEEVRTALDAARAKLFAHFHDRDLLELMAAAEETA